MQAAIAEAQAGLAEGGIPIGSVIVHQDRIVRRGPMCAGAILLYGIPRVVIGENPTFMGDEDLLRSRGVAVGGASGRNVRFADASFHRREARDLERRYWRAHAGQRHQLTRLCDRRRTWRTYSIFPTKLHFLENLDRITR